MIYVPKPDHCQWCDQQLPCHGANCVALLHNDIAICPYCGHADRDSWELGSSGVDSGETDCPNCERTYFWERVIEVSYTTAPLAEPGPKP